MVKDLFDVRGRVAVVTGGFGQLGRQFAATLAERGASVALFDRAGDAARLPDLFGGCASRVHFERADLTVRGEIEGALARVAKRWGVPHVLINNAAIDAPPDAPAAETGPFEGYPLASWQAVLDANLTGAFLASQVVGGAMAEAGRGSIINIGSIYGLVSPDQRIYEYRAADGAPFTKPVAYSVSKSGLLNLTRYLATYWAPRGVRVNTLTFGGVFRDQDPRFLKGYAARVPLGRMAREDEYNGAVLFLASDASSYMTGANLVIDGGWTAW
ncbi:MAG: SDR family oxidoreductase [Planctomycetes bacterium]|nr:SDR family oxidoreductase [Planctomycetota bacterium]